MMELRKRQCIVITAYKDVDMLRCLLNILHDNMICYVHVDKRSWDKFKCLEDEFPDVCIQSNYKVTWGGIEHLKCILEMLDMSYQQEYEYVHIISGEDFLNKSLKDIEDFFDGNTNIYMNYEEVSDKKHHASRRYRYRWLYVRYSMDYKKSWVRYINLIFVILQILFPLFNRERIGEIDRIYWGFVWGSYPKDAVKYVLDYVKNHSDFWKDLQGCKIPEEFCFQTILMNSMMKNRVVNNNLRYWNFDGGDGSGPVYLENEDFRKLEENDAIFARKIKYNSSIRCLLEDKARTNIN